MLNEGDYIPKNLKGTLVTPGDIQKDGHADSEDKEVTLDSLYKEKPLVLFFYPKDMTPGCTIEVKNFRNDHLQIQKIKDIHLLGCSRDEAKSHRKFISKHDLPFPLLSDHKGSITEAFGVWAEKKAYGKTYMGIIRSTFIIDQKGKIIKRYPKVNVINHSSEILAYLKEI